MAFGRMILFAIHSPWGCGVGWTWLALMMLIGAAHDVRWVPGLVLTAQWRPWVRKVGWVWSTTIGRCIIYQPESRDDTVEIDTRIERHEQIHIWQSEDMMALSLLVGSVVYAATGDAWLAGGIYFTGGAWQFPNFITAGLRTGFTMANMYENSEHERSAYGQTDVPRIVGKSWAELKELGDG